MKKILATFLLLLFILSPVLAHSQIMELFGASGGGTINQLDQWVGTTTPSSSITQRVFGKPIKITGLTTDLCLSLDANNVLTTTACGSGGNSKWATSTTDSTAIATAGAEKVGIGTSTPFATFSVTASTTVPTTVFGQSTSTTAGNISSWRSGLDEYANIKGLNPTVKSTLTDSRLAGSEGIAVVGRYAYVVSNSTDRLNIIDISNPLSPAIVGSLQDSNLMNGAEDIVVNGNYAYVTEELGTDFVVIDISNPSDPRITGSVSHADFLNFPEDVYVVGKYAYVSAETGQYFTIIDVGDPYNPVITASFTDALFGNIEGVHVSGKYAYVTAENTDSLVIIDISNPNIPFIVGSVSSVTMNAASGVYVSGKYAYVTAETSSRFVVVDVSIPSAPVIVGSLTNTEFLTGIDNLYVAGKYAYVTAVNDDSVSIIDVSVPTAPRLVGTLISSTALDGPVGIHVDGRYAYVVNSNATGTFSIVDIGGIEIPTLSTGTLFSSTAQIGENLTVGNNLNVFSGASIGPGGLHVGGITGITKFATSSLANTPALSVLEFDNNSSSIIDVFSIGHMASSSASNNIGTGFLFKAEDSSGKATSTAQIASILTNVTAATPASRLSFSTKNTTGSLTEYATLLNNGNFGLGTTTPGTLLSLGNTGNDTINFSATATSTLGSGMNIRSGCYAINSTCIGGITGTDTQVLFFDGANNPAGDAGLTYNKTTDALTSGSIRASATSNQIVLDSAGTATTITDSNPGLAVTVTIPGITGTLASLAGTQTFTGNKTISGTFTATGANGIIVNSASPTFKLTESGGLVDWKLYSSSAVLILEELINGGAPFIFDYPMGTITLGDSAGFNGILNFDANNNIDSQIGGATEMSVTANTLTFNNGTNDTNLNWGTESQLGVSGKLSVVSVNSSTSTPDFIIASSTGNTTFEILGNNHVRRTGPVPTVATGAGDCGTSPSIVGNDSVGRVTVGSVANGGKCTVTFASNWATNAPVCSVHNETTGALIRPALPTVSKVELTGTLLAGDVLNYKCEQY